MQRSVCRARLGIGPGGRLELTFDLPLSRARLVWSLRPLSRPDFRLKSMEGWRTISSRPGILGRLCLLNIWSAVLDCLVNGRPRGAAGRGFQFPLPRPIGTSVLCIED